MATNGSGQAIQKSGGTIKDLLEARKDEIAKVLPKHLTVDRLMRVALTAVSKNPLLQKCTGASLLLSVLNAAELGLEPGGALGHAYLVPFGDQCQLIIGYRGFVELARRSGELAQIEAHVIREKDEFVVEYGLEPKFRHKPMLTSDAGKPVLVYMLARLKDGSSHIEVMTVPDVERIRSRSRSKDKGPWVSDWDEMAKKTVVRRGMKYLPLSSERLAKALDVDEQDYVEGSVVAAEQATAANVEVISKTEALKKRLAPKTGPIIDVPPGMSEEEAIAAHDNIPPPTDADAPGEVASP